MHIREINEGTATSYWEGFSLGATLTAPEHASAVFSAGLDGLIKKVAEHHPDYGIHFLFTEKNITLHWLIGGGKGSRKVELPWIDELGGETKAWYLSYVRYPI